MLGQSVDGAGARRGRAERGTPLIRGDFVGIVGIAPVLSVFGGWLGSRYCVLYVLYYINIILVLNIMEPWYIPYNVSGAGTLDARYVSIVSRLGPDTLYLIVSRARFIGLSKFCI